MEVIWRGGHQRRKAKSVDKEGPQTRRGGKTRLCGRSILRLIWVGGEPGDFFVRTATKGKLESRPPVKSHQKMPSPQNVRRLVLTAAVTSITIASSLYGAGLKTKEEIAEVSLKPGSSASLSDNTHLHQTNGYEPSFAEFQSLTFLSNSVFRPRENARKPRSMSSLQLFRACAPT